MTGKVKWFDSKKGYGFILNEEGREIFVHYTGIVADGFKALAEGQNVEFEIRSRGVRMTFYVRRTIYVRHACENGVYLPVSSVCCYPSADISLLETHRIVAQPPHHGT